MTIVAREEGAGDADGDIAAAADSDYMVSPVGGEDMARGLLAELVDLEMG